jgi:hypothetical protein
VMFGDSPKLMNDLFCEACLQAIKERVYKRSAEPDSDSDLPLAHGCLSLLDPFFSLRPWNTVLF